MSERYPILVERLKGDQALVIVCESCEHEITIGPEAIRNERNYVCPCGGWMDYKYEEADYKCPGCGKLHFDRTPYPKRGEHGTCFRACSRVCHLQDEYARTLAT